MFELLNDNMTLTFREKKDFKEQKVFCISVQWEDLELMETDWRYIFRDLIIWLEELR